MQIRTQSAMLLFIQEVESVISLVMHLKKTQASYFGCVPCAKPKEEANLADATTWCSWSYPLPCARSEPIKVALDM